MNFIEFAKDPTQYSNLSREKWKTIRSLADGSFIIDKMADQGSGSCVVVKADYLQKMEEQLADRQVDKEAKFNKKIVLQLVNAKPLF